MTKSNIKTQTKLTATPQKRSKAGRIFLTLGFLLGFLLQDVVSNTFTVVVNWFNSIGVDVANTIVNILESLA